MAESAIKQLAIVIAGQHAGDIEQGASGKLALRYGEQWRLRKDVTPISLSMPLGQSEHADAVVRPFLWGLLPDNEDVLARWGRQYQVSPRNPFALMAHVGEDCAGAVQFVQPSRLEAIIAGDGGVEWLETHEVARRIRTLRKDPSAWHPAGTAGQFSLAGAQAKMALHFDPGLRRWGDPWGRMPTTHILKPAVSGFDEHDLNEHLCLSAASNVGIDAAESWIESFGDERVIVLERYDRIYQSDGQIVRVHQEDMCQALGLFPAAKYQNEGGPSAEDLIRLLRQKVYPAEVSRRDIARLIDALAFNWIIAGTDAHAKNYSILLSGTRVRLAPLYDIASALPYEDMYLSRLRMAMRVGGEYRIEAISGRHWRRFAEANDVDPDTTIARIRDLAIRIPDAFSAVASAAAVRELGSSLPDALTDLVRRHARSCVESLSR